MPRAELDPVDAFEKAHDDLIRIEALANAALEALNEFRLPPDTDRARFERLYALVTLVAGHSSTALATANELLRRLGRRGRR